MGSNPLHAQVVFPITLQYLHAHDSDGMGCPCNLRATFNDPSGHGRVVLKVSMTLSLHLLCTVCRKHVCHANRQKGERDAGVLDGSN